MNEISNSVAKKSTKVGDKPGVTRSSQWVRVGENIDLLDTPILEDDINNFVFGYYASDLNGDGNVDLLDSPVIESNINNFVFMSFQVFQFL